MFHFDTCFGAPSAVAIAGSRELQVLVVSLVWVFHVLSPGHLEFWISMSPHWWFWSCLKSFLVMIHSCMFPRKSFGYANWAAAVSQCGNSAYCNVAWFCLPIFFLFVFLSDDKYTIVLLAFTVFFWSWGCRLFWFWLIFLIFHCCGNNTLTFFFFSCEIFFWFDALLSCDLRVFDSLN